MQEIVTLTMNPALDLSTRVNSVAPEIKLRCATPRFHPGGGGINVSRAIHFLGGRSSAVYAAGGHTGAMLAQLLTEEGIAHHAQPISGISRESFVVYEESTALQYRFTLPGPQLSTAEWRACLERAFTLRPDWLVLSGSLPEGIPAAFYEELQDSATRRETRVIMDSAGGAAKLAGGGITLVKPNLRELESLAGQKLGDERQIEQACGRLIDSGLAQVMLVSLGAGGALLISSRVRLRIHAPVVPIASKVGAGDSMVGGLVMALAQGRSLMDAARFGVAAGSAAVMTPGTQLCRREDAYRLYESLRNSRRQETAP